MKHTESFYVKGSLLFCVLIVCSYLIIAILCPFVRNDQVYVAATLDKEHRMNTLSRPRLFLVGGSGLSLGINSYRMEKSTGFKVTNMGVHAGLGLPFMLNEAASGLRKGDIVVLSTEYFLGKGDKKLQAQLVDINPNAKSYLNYSFLDELEYMVQQLQRCLSGSFYKLLHADRIDVVYRRSSFNQAGDLTAHHGRPKPKNLGDNITFTQVDFSDGIKYINEFSVAAREKGASVYFTFPAYPQSSYLHNRKAIEDYFTQCKNLLKCHVLGTARESVLPDKYFFDTVYHLDSLGAEKRTDKMINLLISYKVVQTIGI